MTDKSTKKAFAKLLEYSRRGEVFQPGAGTGAHQSDEWSGVTFRLADTRVACNINLVHEILPPPAATAVPGAKPWILGLANVRGALMTVVDLPWFLTGRRTQVTSSTRVLATTLQKAPLGLLIDEVFGQRHFLTSDADNPDLPDDSPLRDLVRHKHQLGTEIWHELDLDRLFRSPEFTNGAAG